MKRRRFLRLMKISVYGKMEGPEGTADWVKAWSDDYGLAPQIDACVLGDGIVVGSNYGRFSYFQMGASA